MGGDKSNINNTMNADLLKNFKVLATQEVACINSLLKEAIHDLLEKFTFQGKIKGKI
jgi:hypothetical protein